MTVAATTTTGIRPAPTCSSSRGSLAYHQIPTSGLTIRLAVYLPPCATEGSHRRYPTVYLLHGARTDETQWPAIGLAQTADELIASREISPLIVVMPNSGLDPGDSTIVDYVVPWADANLPSSAAGGDRAIGGISAGGAAAMRTVALHPTLFSRLGGHSPLVDASPDLPGRLAAWKGPVWFDVGESDGLRPATESASAELRTAGVRVELHVWPGQHDRAYWGAHVRDYLRFYGTR